VQKDGQLGQGDNESHFAPVLVRALEGTGVKSIACGYDFTAALTVEGHLFTCINPSIQQNAFPFLKLLTRLSFFSHAKGGTASTGGSDTATKGIGPYPRW
jgi:alpha-tubulin suppressor-like RCC1 family protein